MISYIAYLHFEIEDDSKDPNFGIIWTSKKLYFRISDDFTQDDATYRLTHQGYPFFVSGRSHPSGNCFPTHVTLVSHEDTQAWASSYLLVKEKATARYVLLLVYSPIKLFLTFFRIVLVTFYS
jgi:hypothetical protein